MNEYSAGSPGREIGHSRPGTEELPAVNPDELRAWAAAIIRSRTGGAVPLPEGAKTPPPAGFTGEKNDMSRCCSVRVVNKVIRNGYTAHDPETQKLRHYNVGGNAIRLADGVAGIDVDAYGTKRGTERLAELEEQLGELPRTYYLTSRGPGQPSRIRLFRATPGRRYGDPGGDIEVIQNHWRYAIGPPSVHPEGRPYILYGPDDEVLLPDEFPGLADLAQLPPTWDDYLSGLYRQANNGKVSASSAEYVKWFQEHGRYSSCRKNNQTVAYWISRQARHEPREGEEFSNHFWGIDAAYAVIGDCVAGHEGAGEALQVLRKAFLREGVARGHSEPSLLDDWRRTVQGAIAQHGMPSERPECDCPESDIPPNLPPEWWERPAHKKIKQAAHSRYCSPDAVLAVLLARMSAMAPPALRCDAGIGPSTLTTFSAICGESESGKSEAIKAAMDLLPELPDYGWEDNHMEADAIFADDIPMGSGEGMAEAFYDSRLVEVGKKKDGSAIISPRRAKYRDHAFIVEDEGKSLTDKMQLTGSEHSAAIRRSWSGRTWGQKNASGDSTRVVPSGTYSVGIAVGFQPGTIAPLLGEGEVGTPQRFCYMSATDPGIPEDNPEWPGELTIVWPEGTHTIGFPDQVCTEIKSARRESARGEASTPILSKHLNQNRMRTAANLAVLDGRDDTNQEDWKLAGIYWDISGQVRDWMAGRDAEKAAKNEANLRAVHTGRKLYEVSATEAREALLIRATGIAIRHIHRPVNRTCKGGVHKRRCITNSVPGEVRTKLKEHNITMDSVFARLITSGEVQEIGDDIYKTTGRKVGR
jgi:hypothetical protein